MKEGIIRDFTPKSMQLSKHTMHLQHNNLLLIMLNSHLLLLTEQDPADPPATGVFSQGDDDVTGVCRGGPLKAYNAGFPISSF